MTLHTRIANVLLGGIVTLVTVPFGVGPALGGWLAGRTADSPEGGALAGGLAGALGVAPWAWLLFEALSGGIDPIGYHQGVVHVGVMTAAPGTFVLWQEVALTGLVGLPLVGVAVAGGLVAGHGWDLVGELRRQLGDGI